MELQWVWLTTRKGLGTRGTAALLERYETAEKIYEMTRAEYEQIAGLDRRALESLCDKSLEEANQICSDCRDKGIELLTYADERYPMRLKEIADPPALLYFRGKLPDFDNEAVIAVVGARRCSAYGMLHAKQFAKLIGASGGVVVSGGAYGIDTMALVGALEANMPVVCVLGCGLDIDYPRSNRYLFRDIECHGCLISEYPPGTPPLAGNFPVRNRLLSGLSLGVLVVEAREKSGALITANHALEQGRDVFAIPGNIGFDLCAGTNRLLREGAYVVENGWEVLQEYEWRFPGKLTDGRKREALKKLYRARYGNRLELYAPIVRPAAGDKKYVDNPQGKDYSDSKERFTELSEDEKTVLSALKNTPVQADTLVADTGLSAQRLTAALTLLQIKGLAVKLPGNCYQRNKS